jgi:hypothetical protein
MAFCAMSNHTEQAMMNLRILGAVVIAASALSSSDALAQYYSNPDACQAEFASCTGLGTGTTPVYRYRPVARRVAYRHPVVAAGPVVGGWGNSYAMYGGGGQYGWNGSWADYAARNGIVCRPGTNYKGADGLMHLCQ